MSISLLTVLGIPFIIFFCQLLLHRTAFTWALSNFHGIFPQLERKVGSCLSQGH